MSRLQFVTFGSKTFWIFLKIYVLKRSFLLYLIKHFIYWLKSFALLDYVLLLGFFSECNFHYQRAA